MDTLQHVAARIRQLRTGYGGQGISQEALAKALKIATNTVSRWETGVYKPDLTDLEKLARFFNTSILTFFPLEDVPLRKDMAALLRAAESLPSEDIVELTLFAEFRRTQRQEVMRDE